MIPIGPIFGGLEVTGSAESGMKLRAIAKKVAPAIARFILQNNRMINLLYLKTYRYIEGVDVMRLFDTEHSARSN
jgi:hypothetical protein